jgi:hypothetical protein
MRTLTSVSPRSRSRRRSTAVLGIIVAAVATILVGAFQASVADAQTTKFYKKFKGQLFVSDQAFQVHDDDGAMVDQVKKRSKTELTGTDGESGRSWDFSYLAVLSKKPGSPNATIYFYEVKGKEKKQVTYKDIGIDGEQLIIVSEISISEDDGLNKGTKYEMVLAVSAGGKQVPLAKGTVMFK